MNNLTEDNFTEANIKKFTIPKLKAFIKEKSLVKTKKCKRKQDYIDCILENKSYVFGGQKPIVKKTESKLFKKTLTIPKTKCFDTTKIVAGIDEAGAGSLSHGVYVSAVILPNECPTPNDKTKLTMWNSIVDSKKYSSNKKKLHALCEYIKEVAISWSLVIVDEIEIDEINIRQARLVGFHRSLDALDKEFNHILVDGDIFNAYKNINHTCINQGDAKYRSIAAASIVAKSSRDLDMINYHKEYPQYNWDKNFGYAGGKNKTHIDLIRENGITKYHRLTYGICKQWKTLPQSNLTKDDIEALNKRKICVKKEYKPKVYQKKTLDLSKCLLDFDD